MSTFITPILLTDAETKNDVEGTLHYDLSSDELRLIDEVWLPYLNAAIPEMQMRGLSFELLPDSQGWNWQSKLRRSRTQSAARDWRFFGLGYRGALQGAMVISATPQPCQAPEHIDRPALGVEFLAAAPWNFGRFMRALKRQPYLDEIGPTLIRVAIEASLAAGCAGRLFLHSVPKAEYFYRQICGMIDLDLEETSNETLRRFEMTQEQAGDFLES